mmetsp:Transcript_42682/g.117782  ORF Transcript_42682/g.117782 Transcript_42682/m.117782 type:complete len:276 (-) Transcript_42682:276-1103(-)
METGDELRHVLHVDLRRHTVPCNTREREGSEELNASQGAECVTLRPAEAWRRHDRNYSERGRQHANEVALLCCRMLIQAADGCNEHHGRGQGQYAHVSSQLASESFKWDEATELQRERGYGHEERGRRRGTGNLEQRHCGGRSRQRLGSGCNPSTQHMSEALWQDEMVGHARTSNGNAERPWQRKPQIPRRAVHDEPRRGIALVLVFVARRLPLESKRAAASSVQNGKQPICIVEALAFLTLATQASCHGDFPLRQAAAPLKKSSYGDVALDCQV